MVQRDKKGMGVSSMVYSFELHPMWVLLDAIEQRFGELEGTLLEKKKGDERHRGRVKGRRK